MTSMVLPPSFRISVCPFNVLTGESLTLSQPPLTRPISNPRSLFLPMEAAKPGMAIWSRATLFLPVTSCGPARTAEVFIRPSTAPRKPQVSPPHL